MHRTEIKICGLSTEEAVLAAVNGGADMLGFIFFEKSPRNISVSRARDLCRLAGPHVRKVAVSVNASDALLSRIVDEMKPDMLQLHGSETPHRTAEIRSSTGLPVIKAFAIQDMQDLENTKAWKGAADRFLLDAKPPAGSELPGGNGVQFDWNLLAQHDAGTDYLLSGGLNCFNVVEALEISGAGAVDVSSGVESAPGVKDIEKITVFSNTIRELDRTRSVASKQRAGK